MTGSAVHAVDDHLVRAFTRHELAYLTSLAFREGDHPPTILGLPAPDELDEELRRACGASLAARGLLHLRGESIELDDVAGAVGVALAALSTVVALEFAERQSVDSLRIVEGSGLWRLSLHTQPFGVLMVGLLDAEVPLADIVADACRRFLSSGDAPRGVTVQVASGPSFDAPLALALLSEGGEGPISWRRLDEGPAGRGLAADTTGLSALLEAMMPVA